MIDERQLLRDAAGAVDPPRDVMDGLVHRRDRKRRSRRVGSAVVAVVTVAAVAAALGRSLGSGGNPPVDHPTPTATVSQAMVGAVVVGLDGTVRSRVPDLPFGTSYLALSPDGRTVAFTANHDGGIAIATVRIDGTGLRWLTDVWAARMPAWSPDGSRIAFVGGMADRHGPQHVYVVNADGSGQRRLTNQDGFAQWPAWSPDGSTIAYSRTVTDRLFGPLPLNAGPDSATEEIWTVPPDGGAPAQLTDNTVWDDMPSWSPDGSQLAFAREGVLWVMGADGSDQRQVAGQPAGGGLFNPAWSPDGTRLAFTTDEGELSADGNPLLGVGVMDLRTGAVTVLPGRVLAGPGTFPGGAPSWLPTSDGLLMNRYRN